MNAFDRFKHEAENTGGAGTALACVTSGRNPSPLCMAAIAEFARAIQSARDEAVEEAAREANKVANAIAQGQHKACRWPSANASLGVAEEIGCAIRALASAKAKP